MYTAYKILQILIEKNFSQEFTTVLFNYYSKFSINFLHYLTYILPIVSSDNNIVKIENTTINASTS